MISVNLMRTQLHFLLASVLLLSLGVLYSSESEAALECPATPASVESGAMAVVVGFYSTLTSGPPLCFKSFISGSDYNDIASHDFTWWAANLRLIVALPDDSSDSGATGANSGARVIFSPTGGTSRSTVTVSCPGATITGNVSTVPEIVLAAGTACVLTATSTLVDAVSYTTTLTRTGNVYTTSIGELSGDVFGAPSAPEIDVERNSSAIADGGTDAQGTVGGGQVTLTYTVNNTGDADLNISNITSSGATNVTVDSISSTSFTVGASGSTTFDVKYTPTSGGAFSFDLDITSDDSDEGNYDIIVSGTADLTAPTVEILNAPASITTQDSFTVTFEFSEDVNNFVLGDISVGNGSASNFNAVDGNTYTADITPDTGGDVSIDVNAAVATDDAGNDNTAATQVVVTCGAGCGEAATVQATKKRIQNFLRSRGSRMASQQANLGLAGLLTGHGLGGGFSNGFAGGPAGLGFSSDEAFSHGNFSFNLRQFVNSQSQQARSSDDMALNGAPTPNAGSGQNAFQSRYNFWVKGTWVHTREDRGNIDEKSDFSIVHVGADYRYSKDILIGVLGQLDYTEEKSRALGSEAKGKGWMLGPYLVTRLTDNLILDVQASYGESDNKINPLGTYWDDFDTERWQLSGNLTGSFDRGKWHISPSIGLVYFKETQKAYTDTNGFRIGKQTFELGSLNFGPTFSYRIDRPNGVVIRPLIGIKGVYDFKSPDLSDVNGLAVGTEDFRAQLTLGLNVLTRGGSTIQATYTHDGIGVSDFESRTAQITFSTPIKGMTDGTTLQGSYSLSGADAFSNEDGELNQDARLEIRIPFE